MRDKFNPEDLKNPLYEYSQVVTIQDLKTMYRGLIAQYYGARWWEIRARFKIVVACRALHEIISWIQDGKQPLLNLDKKGENYHGS